LPEQLLTFPRHATAGVKFARAGLRQAEKNRLSRRPSRAAHMERKRRFTPVFASPRAAAKNQRNQKQDKKHDEQNFRDPCRGPRDSSEAEECGDQRHDEEYD
jgi:hypothetical protein